MEKKHLSMKYVEKEFKVRQMEHIEKAIESMAFVGKQKEREENTNDENKEQNVVE